MDRFSFDELFATARSPDKPLARERVLHYLILHADPQTMTVALPGTVKDLANDLAIAHETLYRTLATLETEEKIERGEGFIKLS